MEFLLKIHYKVTPIVDNEVCSGMLILSLEDLYNKSYMGEIMKYNSITLFYGERYGSYLRNARYMSVEEFERIFSSERIQHLLGKGSPFSKEILGKYGVRKGQKKFSSYSGGAVFGSGLLSVVYLGNFKSFVVRVNSRNVFSCSGHLYWNCGDNGSEGDLLIQTVKCYLGYSFKDNFSCVKHKKQMDCGSLSGYVSILDCDSGLLTDNIDGYYVSIEWIKV